MPVIFECSRKLKRAVEDHNWALYDTASLRDADSFWKNIDEMSPAESFEIGHNYIFIPNPPAQKTRKQAYDEVGKLGPSLKLPLSYNSNKSLRGRLGISHDDFNIYLFSHLCFQQKYLTATSPNGLYHHKAPSISVAYPQVEKIFSEYFTITTRDDLQAIVSQQPPKILN